MRLFDDWCYIHHRWSCGYNVKRLSKCPLLRNRHFYLCPHNWWYLGLLKTTSPLRLEEVLWLCHHIGRPLYFGKCSLAQVTLSFHLMFASRSLFLFIKNDAFAHIHPDTKSLNWVFNMLLPQKSKFTIPRDLQRHGQVSPPSYFQQSISTWNERQFCCASFTFHLKKVYFLY